MPPTSVALRPVHRPRLRDPYHLPGDVQTESLFRRYRSDGDRGAREVIVRRYLPLARALAGRYARSSEPYEELVQVASLALVKAIERFDPDRGSDFRSFAVPTILGELKRHFRDAGWAVHVPRSIQERALLIQEASERLTAGRGRSPTVEEIAEDLGLPADCVLEGLLAAQGYDAISLEQGRGAAPEGAAAQDGYETTVGEMLGAEDERYELVEADVTLAQALRVLPERERRILYLRFVGDLTQSEIATELGVSQMQISRLLRRALGQLRALAAPAGA